MTEPKPLPNPSETKLVETMSDRDIQYEFRKLSREISRQRAKARSAHDLQVAAQTRAHDLKLRAKTAEYSLRGLCQREQSLKAELEQTQAALASLADELRLAREDARRYRWLRDSDSEWSTLFADPIKWDGGGWVKLGSRWVREHFDAAIDEALKDAASSGPKD